MRGSGFRALGVQALGGKGFLQGAVRVRQGYCRGLGFRVSFAEAGYRKKNQNSSDAFRCAQQFVEVHEPFGILSIEFYKS